MRRYLAVLLGLLASSTTLGQPSPVGSPAPLVIVVGGPPGTPGDVVARVVSGPLAIELAQPVVVENKPGAAGTVALASVARAGADAQVIGVLALQSAVAPALIKSLPYDTVRDLAAVRQLSSVSNLLVVRADSPWTSLEDLVRAAPASNLTYASGGNGTPAHLAAELFAQEARMQLQHVPFNGAVAGVTALLGGHVQMMFATTPAVVPLVQAGKLRALATTAAQRLQVMPDVPTMAESGLTAVTMRDWHGFVVPAATSPTRVEQIAAATGRALASEAVRQRLAGAGLEPAVDSNPTEFRNWIASEMGKWEATVRRGGISLQ